MLKHITMIFVILLATAGSSLARLSEPDVIFKGKATMATAGSTISLRLVGASTPLASATLGPDLAYVLRIPMVAFEPRIPGTAMSGDAAEILINSQVVRSLAIPARGTIVLLDLDPSRSAEQWALDHPGDNGSGDMNRNGISDLQEYLDGGDPAGCVWVLADVTHAETTVYHPKVLTNCLADAGEDALHNLVRIASGSYAGNFVYKTGWKEDFDLILIGGYDVSGSGVRTINPALTIMNGDIDSDQIGNGVILAIDTDTNKTAGKVLIDGLIFKNGKAPTGQNGGAIQAIIYQGDLELVGNIFTVNSAESGGAVSAESRGSALIFMVNNLLYANSAANAAAALINSATAILLNNTIVENAATANGDGRSLLIKTSAASGMTIQNNIISGFTSVVGKDLYISNSESSMPVVTHNSLAASDLLVNTSGFIADQSNVVCNPQFVSLATGNYRLGASSTCIDKGFAHSRQTDMDIVGSSRKSGKDVDLGAYEYQQPNPTLTMTITNSGSVQGTASPSGQTYSCDTANCPAVAFAAGDRITLTAIGSGSNFNAWSGACPVSENPCVLDLVGNMGVGVAFTSTSGMTVIDGSPSTYATLALALATPTQKATVRARDMDFSENIIHSNIHEIIVRGGFSDSDFSDQKQSGYTSISGSLKIRAGRLTVERLRIKP